MRKLAQSDTPAEIVVPNTWSGIVIWAIGRFGVGVLMAAVFAYGLREVYADNKSLISQQMEAFREQTKVNAQTLIALDQIKLELHDAHTRAAIESASGALKTTSTKSK